MKLNVVNLASVELWNFWLSCKVFEFLIITLFFSLDIARDYIFTASYTTNLGAAMGDLIMVGNSVSTLTGYVVMLFV